MTGTSIELEPAQASTPRSFMSHDEHISVLSNADSDMKEVLSGGVSRQVFSLPPVDGGKNAWLFLAACFVMEALVWGFPSSFGVFQDYYRTHEPFKGSSQIAVIGTCSTGIMYLILPVIMGLYRLYPQQSRYVTATGLLLMCGAMVSASFSQTTTHLVATQGVLYAIGGTMAYCPCLLYMSEWFVKRRGLAYGVMWSGTGLGGLVTPLLLEFFLGRYGFRTTLRIWACTLFVLIIPLVAAIKSRLPASAMTHVKPFNLGFMLQRDMLLFQLSNIVEATGYFLPSIYLPSYARTSLGAGSISSALTVVVVNIGSVFGCIAMGALIDRLDVYVCILISTLGTAIGIFFLWGFAANMAVLYIFCLIYGIFAGSYTATYPGLMKQIKGAQDPNSADPTNNYGESSSSAQDPTMIFGILATGRGIGNIISGPLSEALIKGMPWQGRAAGGYGSGYGTLITFTGASAMVGGVSYLFKRAGWM